MSSFACITNNEWKDSQKLGNSLEQFTLDYIEELKKQKQNIRKELERNILRLEKEMQSAHEILKSH